MATRNSTKPKPRGPCFVVKDGSVSVKIYATTVRKKLKDGTVKSYATFTFSYIAGGIRRTRNLASLDDAKTAARSVASQIASGRQLALTLTNSDRESYLAAIAALREVGDVPLHKAVASFVAQEKERLKAGRPVPVPDVVAELLGVKTRDRMSSRYLESLRSHLLPFATEFPRPIAEVSSRVVEQWLDNRKLSSRSRNNIRGSLKTLFAHARRVGYLPRGETQMDSVRRVPDRGGEIGILAPDQLARLIEQADEEARLYLVLGAFTGVRSAELLRLEWNDVNFERGHIIVGAHKAKTASRRLVPIKPNLAGWLAEFRGRKGLVFPSGRKAAERTLAYARGILGTWPSNALRHSYASYRLAECQDAARVALEMGNSPTMLFRNYRELVDETKAAQWFSIAPAEPANVVRMAK